MSRAEQLITDNLDIWTAAIQNKTTTGRGSNKKQKLYGIKKLRELILELAVRGLLVPQDPMDKPASVLLERIAAKKARLVKEGKLKKQQKLPPIREEEKAFNLPEGWEWVSLSQLGIFSGGKTPSKSNQNFWDGDIPWVTPKDMKVKEVYDSEDHVTKLALENGLALVEEQSLLFVVRSGILRRKFPVAITRCSCTVNQDLKVLTLVDRTLCEYLQLMMNGFESYILAKLTKTGTTVESLRFEDFSKHFFMIPPEEEQKRIVAKVNELMSLCDQLEQQTEASLTAHQTLVETLLKALLDAAQSRDDGSHIESAFEQAWQRIADHFDVLFTTEHSIDQLKQAILQLAVMGKLVPQDPNDEPASVLLEKIAAEKERLVKEGKIKKQKPLISFAGLEEMKFEIPLSWEWIRLADTADIVRGGSPRPAGDPKFYDGNIPFLKVADVTNNKGKSVEGYTATIKEAGLRKTRYIDQKTVLLSNSGATLGVPAICDFPATFNDGIAAFVEQSTGIMDEYLYLYLKGKTVWFLEVASRGQGQPNLNTDIIKASWFPLPPFSEQKRIVQKVDDLMACCDLLKTSIRESQYTQFQLADVMCVQALT